jgi:hypothetical protein
LPPADLAEGNASLPDSMQISNLPLIGSLPFAFRIAVVQVLVSHSIVLIVSKARQSNINLIKLDPIVTEGFIKYLSQNIRVNTIMLKTGASSRMHNWVLNKTASLKAGK